MTKLPIKSLGVLSLLMHTNQTTTDFLYASVPDTPAYIDNILNDLIRDNIIKVDEQSKEFAIMLPQGTQSLLTSTKTESVHDRVFRLFSNTRTYYIIADFIQCRLDGMLSDDKLRTLVESEYESARIIQRYDYDKITDAFHSLFESRGAGHFGMQTVLEYLNRASRG